MDIEKVAELGEEAIRKINGSDFKGALNLARQIQKLGTHHFVSYMVGGLLIDIGSALEDGEIVEEGVHLLLRDFAKIISNKKYTPTAYYNLGNGYSAIFHFKKMKNPYAACFNETELTNAKTCYRKAFEYAVEDTSLCSQILVNLGNCFDQLGRVVEALECYEKALQFKPDHGMALANKGVALYYYAGLAGEHLATFMLDAHFLLTEGLKLGVDLNSASYFKQYLKRIRKRFTDKKVLGEEPKFPGYKIKGKSEFENFLIKFCLENKLYLNICNYCQKCNAAIGDQIVIKEMIAQHEKHRRKDPLKEDQFLRLSAYVNQIKQDYITARFLLVLSRYKGINLDFVDKNVKIINTLDYSMHNIYIQLLKASFKSLYDILDKIACILNDYLGLGIPETRIDFRRIWYSEMKTKTIDKKITGTKNFSLNALFDMYRDFEEGPYKKLRDTRNALTHRFVNVRMFQEAEDAENMTEQTLFKQTVELAKLTRNATIYLLQFVYIEEKIKMTRLKGITVPMFAREIPDNLKCYR